MDRTTACRVFEDLLKVAAPRVRDEYFNLAMYNEAESEPDKKQLERVYCYELYHAMRSIMERNDPRIDGLAEAITKGWRVNAEVDKRSNMSIDRSDIPDFLWHVAGLPYNGTVVEVKIAKAPWSALRADIAKLKAFGSAAGYHDRILLVLGDVSATRRRELASVARVVNLKVVVQPEAESQLVYL